MSVLQFGQVIARSHVPRGDCEGAAACSMVVGGFATCAGLPGVNATYAEGGSVPRGNFSMTGFHTTPL